MSLRAALTEAQWEQVAELSSSSESGLGLPFRNHRQVVEGSSTGTGPASPGGTAREGRPMADGVEAPSPGQSGRHLDRLFTELPADGGAACPGCENRAPPRSRSSTRYDKLAVIYCGGAVPAAAHGQCEHWEHSRPPNRAGPSREQVPRRWSGSAAPTRQPALALSRAASLRLGARERPSREQVP